MLLFVCEACGQYLVGIDAHNQVDDLFCRDFAEPVRRVRRNDDHVTGADFAAHAILDAATFLTRTVQERNRFVVRRNFLESLSILR